jgi:hypothetical protein
LGQRAAPPKLKSLWGSQKYPGAAKVPPLELEFGKFYGHNYFNFWGKIQVKRYFREQNIGYIL